MKRNFKNYIVWKKPEEAEDLALEPKKSVFNTEEIQAIFETQVSETLATGQTRVFGNAPVQISTEIQTARTESGSVRSKSVKISLDVEGKPPYSLTKQGEVIGQGLEVSDFPFVDQKILTQSFVSPTQSTTRGEQQTVTYRIESQKENVDTAETTIEV